jgi:hypothetical protein
VAIQPSYIGKSSVDIIRTEGSNTTYTKWWARFSSIPGLAIGDRLFAVIGLFKTTPETTVIAPPGWSRLLNMDAALVYTKIATQDDTWPELVALAGKPQNVSFIFYNPRAGGLRILGEFCEVYCYRNAKIIDGAAGVRKVPNVGSPGSPHPLPLTRSRYPASSVQFSGELSFRFSGPNFGNSLLDGHAIRSRHAPSPSNTWSWVVGDSKINTTNGKSMAASAKGWPGNTVSFDSYHDFAIVMVASTPPATPQLLSPRGGERIDIQNIQPIFDWAYSSEDGSPQDAYALRRSLVTGSSKGAYQYWNAATGTWSGSIVWNSTSASQVVFPTGVWENGKTYAWSVAVRSQADQPSAWATDSLVVGDTAPLVTITGPSTLVTNTSSPNVVWQSTDPEAQPQQTYEVAILLASALNSNRFDYQDPLRTAPAGSVVWSSGETQGTQQWRTTPPLHNKTNYVVFVRINNGQYSPWAWESFALALTVPNSPSISVAVE